MWLVFLFTSDMYRSRYEKEIFKPDKTNSIELRSIYNIGVGIAKSLINLQNEEIFLWYEYHYGPFGL